MKLPLGNSDTLLGRASRALSLSFLSTAILRLSTLGIGVLLARLLGPHQFGTYAVALVALLAVLSFNELGVSLAIVRWPGDPAEIAPTVATISCVSSVILFGAFYLGAPAFSSVMGAPAATPVIRVLSASLLINCVVAVPDAMLQRQFQQGRKMIADQVHSWSYTGVAIGMAWAGFGAMSLAVASVVGATAGGIVIMVFSRPPRFGFDPVQARALLRFGLPLAGSSFIVFLVGNVDNVIVGHMLGPTALGFYVLAWNLSSWPVTMFSLPVRSVAPALFSRLQHDRNAMHTGFTTGVGLLASVALPVCLLMSGAARPLVGFAYGARWAPAAAALVWLAGVGALRILFELSYDYFVVLARSRVVFTVQLAWLVALVPALIVGTRIDGVRGAAIAGVGVAGGLVLPWYLIELHKVGIGMRSLGSRTWLPLLCASATGFFTFSLTTLLKNNLAVLLAGGTLALGMIAWLIYVQLPDLAILRTALANADDGAETAEAVAGIDSPQQKPVDGQRPEPVSATLAFEQAVAGSAEPGLPPPGSRVARPAPKPPADATMPIPMLQQRLRQGLFIDSVASRADLTGPLPIFRDVLAPGTSEFASVPFLSQHAGHPHSREPSHAHRIAHRRHLLRSAASRSHAVVMVQAFAIALMVFPSNLVFKAVGADGYVAILIAYAMLLAWIAATLFGLHNPLRHRHPIRMALWSLWLVSLASYALIDPAIVTPLERASADRWLMQLAGVSGVILLAAEGLRSLEDVRRVLRALTWGGAFCGIVAGLQYGLRLDITPYLRWVLPGFSENQAASSNAEIVLRGALSRAFGTATDAIELGVSAGMLLPLAVYLAMHDIKRPAFSRWFPVVGIGIAATVSVSRSAVVAIVLSMGVFIVLMRPAQRVKAFAAMPLAIAAIFMTSHGLIGTLKSFFVAGTSDPSIAHRVNNYPLVEHLVSQAPWLGQGGGTYIAQSALYILDNQYLTTAIELGLVGVSALLFYFVWPVIAALVARKRTDDPEIRDLCAALAGAALAAAACAATFDALSFPMFVGVQALVVGLIGAVWLIVNRDRDLAQSLVTSPFDRAFIDTLNMPKRAGAGVSGPAGGN